MQDADDEVEESVSASEAVSAAEAAQPEFCRPQQARIPKTLPFHRQPLLSAAFCQRLPLGSTYRE